MNHEHLVALRDNLLICVDPLCDHMEGFEGIYSVHLSEEFLKANAGTRLVGITIQQLTEGTRSHCARSHCRGTGPEYWDNRIDGGPDPKAWKILKGIPQ